MVINQFVTGLRQTWIAAVLIAAAIGGTVFMTQQRPLPQKPSIIVQDIPAPKQPVRLASHSVQRMKEGFLSHNYDLEDIRNGVRDVPRLWPDRVPEDLASVTDVQLKKKMFLQFLLPVVLQVNEDIETNRKRARDISNRIALHEHVSAGEVLWLDGLSQRYRTEIGDIDALLHKMDVLPVSLVLVQAAVESGWGTSRFARKGNALFGQWTTSEFEGMVPLGREQGKTHKIRTFRTPLEAIQSYTYNVNTHRAYDKLREIRAQKRAEYAGGASGYDLAAGLEAYSEKGWEYVDLIRGMIKHNKLEELNAARLDDNLTL